MARTLPERTVDSMVAMDIVRMQPNAIITSPTNTKGQVDHLIRRGLSVTLLECKGVEGAAEIPIDMKQLWEYTVGRGPAATIYVLPSRPPAAAPAFRRPCGLPCCGPAGCRFCPRDARSWAGLEAWVDRLPALEDRLQPWFAHWAWCVPCTQLAAHFKLHAKPTKRQDTLQWDDAVLGGVPGAVRLCHMFGGPVCEAARRSAATPADVPDDLEDQPPDSQATPPLIVVHSPPPSIEND